LLAEPQSHCPLLFYQKNKEKTFFRYEQGLLFMCCHNKQMRQKFLASEIRNLMLSGKLFDKKYQKQLQS
jgi:hypothetical protein